MTGLWLALFDRSDCCLCDTSSGGVKAMLEVGYDRPAAQPHAPEDDILQPSISGRDSIPEDRHVLCIRMPCIRMPCITVPCVKTPCIKGPCVKMPCIRVRCVKCPAAKCPAPEDSVVVDAVAICIASSASTLAELPTDDASPLDLCMVQLQHVIGL